MTFSTPRSTSGGNGPGYLEFDHPQTPFRVNVRVAGHTPEIPSGQRGIATLGHWSRYDLRSFQLSD